MANPNGGLMVTPQLIQAIKIQDGTHKVFNKAGETYVSVSKDSLKHGTIKDKKKLLADIVNNTVYHWEHSYDVELKGIYDHDWEFVFAFTLTERAY